jgi:hypothetical protein
MEAEKIGSEEQGERKREARIRTVSSLEEVRTVMYFKTFSGISLKLLPIATSIYEERPILRPSTGGAIPAANLSIWVHVRDHLSHKSSS